MIRFTRKILSNGLPFLFHHDPTTPFAVVNLLYRVGARDEDPERTGFAHLFEHLMFEGTEQVPDFDHPLQQAGGINNAFTNNDYTNYYIKIPRENLDLALYLEADRMQHLTITEKTLSTQKKVVIEEFKEHYTNKPYGDVWHILREMIYEQHPYRWPTIGRDFRHIEEASLADVTDFFRKFYHPSNAILCIAGNVEEGPATQLAEKYLGGIPNGRPAADNHYDEPLQLRARMAIEHRKVPLDALYIAFKMPGRNTRSYYTADILTDILAGGKSARLNDRLVRQKRLFVQIDAYISGTLETGMVVIEGKVAESVSVEAAESAVWGEIARLSEEGPEERELDKVKHKLVTYLNFSENNLLSRAIGLCYHEWLGDAGRINSEESRFQAVTTEDIREFTREYLNRERSSTLFYLNEAT